MLSIVELTSCGEVVQEMIPDDGLEHFRWDGGEADWAIACRASAVSFIINGDHLAGFPL